MVQGWALKGLSAGVFAAAVAAPSVAFAQEATDPAPINTGNVSWTLGIDFVTEYWFRGIAQENQGIIAQPYADVTFSLISEGNITLDVYTGLWNSLHENASEEWYEADFFIGGAIGLPGGFAVDISYVNLYSPAGGTSFAEEIDVAVSYDDTALWEGFGLEGFALAPYALVAYEIDAGSDALGRAGEEGTYLELGVEPTFALTQSGDYPLSLSVPITAGFGISDYYETGLGGDDDGEDFTFGFLDIGGVVSTPLPFIPADYGAWEASAGVHYIILGDEAQDISGPQGFNVTGDDDDSIYLTFGVSMSY